jgi:hypothetical protein
MKPSEMAVRYCSYGPKLLFSSGLGYLGLVVSRVPLPQSLSLQHHEEVDLALVNSMN